jgi:hypothetical protein
LAQLDWLEEAKTFLGNIRKKRPEVKKTSDYEKVAPTIIKDVFILWSNQGRTAND